MQLRPFLPHRHPAHLEPSSDRQDPLATVAGRVNLVYLFDGQRCSTPSLINDAGDVLPYEGAEFTPDGEAVYLDY